MPRVSHYTLDKNQLGEIIDHFTYLLSSLNNSSDTENFLNEFLTSEEKVMLAKRLVLFMMLAKNYQDQSIQHHLHLSRETVRLYKNNYGLKSTSFHKTVAKLLTREKTKEFFKKIEAILDVALTVATAKTNMKSRAKLLTGL